jgi:ABC-type transport system substrate-binding protein
MPKKRPFGVTLFLWMVLSLSAWGLLRLLAVLRWWDALDQFQNYGRLLIYGSLTTYDPSSTVVGDLATTWNLDGTSWVFTLRDGVTWRRRQRARA